MLFRSTGIKLASNTSKKSRNYTQKKDYGEVEGMEDFAFKKIDEGFDYVVMGHRHLAKFIEHKLGVYVNLGDWLKTPTYGVFDGHKMELKKVEEFSNKDIEVNNE